FYDGIGDPSSLLCLSCLLLGPLQEGGAIPVVEIRRDQRHPGGQKLRLNRGIGRGKVDERSLPSVTVGRIVDPAQANITASESSRQCPDATGLGWSHSFDAGKPDFTSIVETKAAAIDDLGDMTFAQPRRRA